MSEQRLNERRNWKAQTFSYDYYLPDHSPECSYCLTDKQAELLRGILLPVGWATRWWSDSNADIDPDTVEAFRDDLIRRLMMSCCSDDGDTLKRLTPEGIWQTSVDNGATWQDNTSSDPRRTAPLRPTYPAPEGETPLCEWADSITTVFKTQFVDTLDTEGDLQSLFVAMSAVLALIFGATGVGAILVALTAIPAIIFALGISAFKDAMTDAVWNRLRCNIFSHMDGNGIGTQAQVDAIYSQIGTDETGVSRLFLQSFVALLGVQGMANAANFGLGNADADCDCLDWIRIYVSTGGGSETSWDGTWLHASPVHDGSHYTLFLQSTDPALTFDVNNCATYRLEVLTGTVSVSDSSYLTCSSATSTPIGLTDLADICTCQLAIRNLEDVPFTVRVRALQCS